MNSRVRSVFILMCQNQRSLSHNPFFNIRSVSVLYYCPGWCVFPYLYHVCVFSCLLCTLGLILLCMYICCTDVILHWLVFSGFSCSLPQWSKNGRIKSFQGRYALQDMLGSFLRFGHDQENVCTLLPITLWDIASARLYTGLAYMVICYLQFRYLKWQLNW